MNCVLFAKMDQVFSLKKNKTLKKYWKNGKNSGKIKEKSGNFVSPEKWEPHMGIPFVYASSVFWKMGAYQNATIDLSTQDLSRNNMFQTYITILLLFGVG